MKVIVRRAASAGFWAGVLVVIGYVEAYRNLLGESAYIEMMQERWSDHHPAWGVALMAIGVALYLGAERVARWGEPKEPAEPAKASGESNGNSNRD